MTPIGDTITNALRGHTVDYFAIEGTTLLIQFTSGQRARIGWYDGMQKQKGEPVLEQLDFIGKLKL